MSAIRFAAVAFTVLTFPITALAAVVDTNVPAISYVSFESPNLLSPEEPLAISGQLRIPKGGTQGEVTDGSENPIPAVVVLHGSAGVDSRGSLYIEALNGAGIATLEIDMWGARGMTSRPPALPDVTVPDAFSALKFLAARPDIDSNRIGVLGFSWGGVVALLSATGKYTDLYGDGLAFAAHVAHYPVCWAYSAGLPGIFFEDLTAAPVLIQIGDQDDYDEGGELCESLAAPFTNVSVKVYQNSYHAWDRLQPAMTVIDPFSHQGDGGEVTMMPNPGKAFQSRSNVVQFFESALDDTSIIPANNP